MSYIGTGFGGAYLNNLLVTSGNTVLYQEHFDISPGEKTMLQVQQGWESLQDVFDPIAPDRSNRWFGETTVRRTDPSWINYRVEADMAVEDRRGYGIQIGGDTFSSFRLNITQQGFHLFSKNYRFNMLKRWLPE